MNYVVLGERIAFVFFANKIHDLDIAAFDQIDFSRRMKRRALLGINIPAEAGGFFRQLSASGAGYEPPAV